MRAKILPVILTLLLLPAGSHAATAGEAGPRVVVTHDTPEDGTTYVGNVNHFGWVLFGEDGAPAFHHDAVVEITLDGRTLYKTEPSSGHDYDGVDEIQISFPTTGTYEVSVTIPTGEGEVTDTFQGQVLAAPDATASLPIDGPETATAGEPVTFTYELLDADDDRIPHSDVLVQVRDVDQSKEILRVHTHTHEDTQTFQHVFTEPGTYEVVFLGYQAFPSPDSAMFGPVREVHEITVEEGEMPDVPAASPGAPTNRPLENRVDAGSNDGPYELWATYDPYTSVGVFGRIHLTTVITDAATGDPVPHVDLDASLTGPGGQVLFQSETLHEYDGVFHLAGAYSTPGDYTLEVTAEKGAWTDTTTHRFSVHPPVVPMAAGPQFATLDHPDTIEAGTPTKLTVKATDEAGRPFDHSEMTVTVRDGTTGLPLLSDKVHTHASGTFPITATFPTQGDYVVEVDGVDLEPTAATQVHGPSADQPPIFDVTVEDGPGLGGPDEQLDAAGDQAPDTVPGPGAWIAVLVGLCVAGIIRVV